MSDPNEIDFQAFDDLRESDPNMLQAAQDENDAYWAPDDLIIERNIRNFMLRARNGLAPFPDFPPYELSALGARMFFRDAMAALQCDWAVAGYEKLKRDESADLVGETYVGLVVHKRRCSARQIREIGALATIEGKQGFVFSKWGYTPEAHKAAEVLKVILLSYGPHEDRPVLEGNGERSRHWLRNSYIRHCNRLGIPDDKAFEWRYQYLLDDDDDEDDAGDD